MADLKEIAYWYYDLCELWEDEDLDPDDHTAVIERAFMSSDCDDFAWAMHEITGWPVVKLTWQINDWGMGHHSVVRNEDGMLVDVRGQSRIEDIRTFFKLPDGIELHANPAAAQQPMTFELDPEDTGMAMLLDTMRHLGHAPFVSDDFQMKLQRFQDSMRNELKLG